MSNLVGTPLMAQLEHIFKVVPKTLAGDNWAKKEGMRAQAVALHRRYYDGDYDANMTREIRQALRVAVGRELGADQCEHVINAMADRLTVTGIQGSTDSATAWLKEIMDANRFDGFQMPVYEDELVDGETFVMVDWDEDRGHVRWTHERTFDGISGVIPLGMRDGKLSGAIKIWHESSKTFADTLRVNLYAPHKIGRFVDYNDGLGWQAYSDDGFDAVQDWTDRAGQPLGVMLVPFANQPTGGRGKSRIKKIIGLQDAINRLLHSILMVCELSGFPIRYTIGFKPPARVVPGGVWAFYPHESNDDEEVEASPEDIELFKLAKVGQLDVAQLTPLLEAYAKLEQQIGKITGTPDIGDVSDDASGESRKEAEKKLLGAISKFHVTTGNSWEDVAALSARVQDTFGNRRAPASDWWRTKWKHAEMRGDKDVVEIAVLIEKLAGRKEALRIAATASVIDWDEERIAQLIAELEERDEQIAQRFISAAPGFAGRPAGGQDALPAGNSASSAPADAAG